MKKKFTAWAIVSPKGKVVGMNLHRNLAWYDADYETNLSGSGTPSQRGRQSGYKAVKFSFSL